MRQLEVRHRRKTSRTMGRKVFSWAGQNIDLDPDETSSFIFGDAFVLSILRHAFRHSLSRKTVWDITDVSVDLAPSIIAAARVYKRGVEIIPEIVQDHRETSECYYTARFETAAADCFARARADDVIIADETVFKFWWHQLPPETIVFKFSEATKNPDAVRGVIKKIRERVGEQSTVFVVGGGVAGDVVGFAAGLMGRRCYYVPTTLLSMVDSSIGGKVGVNFETWGKNQLGLFHPPAGVSIWPGWLATLDESEWLSGCAEALKHAVLKGDHPLFRDLVDGIRSGDRIILATRMREILTLKRDVVCRDPFESGERAILNFGHTLGHALESFAASKGKAVTHGECVAVGMAHALRLSAKYFGFNADSWMEGLRGSRILPRPERLLSIFGDNSALAAESLTFKTLIAGDKKTGDEGLIQFTLLSSSGAPARGARGEWTVPFEWDTAWKDILDTWDLILSF